MTPSQERYLAMVAEKTAPLKVNVPEGQSGDWRVDKFEVKRDTIEFARCLFDGRPVPEGTYTRLSCTRDKWGTLFMTDTPAEMNDARTLFWQATGHVLITGLGLGMVPRALLTENTYVTGKVERVTVVELEQDVINLVGPSLKHLPVEIVCADAFTWTPPVGVTYDWAWHDIWPSMGPDELPELARLKRRYQRRMAAPGRQIGWLEDQARADKRRYG